MKGIVELFHKFKERGLDRTHSFAKFVDCCKKFLQIFGGCSREQLEKMNPQSVSYFIEWVNYSFALPTILI